MTESLVERARDIGRLICPLPEDVENGDVVERMPNDLLDAAVMIGNLCDLVEELATVSKRLAMAAQRCADQNSIRASELYDADKELRAALEKVKAP